ncbi:MAG: glucose-6-phosphate isomerase, partial [Muribaculum sp.]|nr:glucose-6-phosphate isomerase [Muribaculum sp.]
MKSISVNINSALGTVDMQSVSNLEKTTGAAALETLKTGTGEGNDFLGWLDLPERTPMHHLDEIQAVADDLRGNCDYVVSVGIGGSY